MLIENFITENPNWESILAEPPYCVKTTWDGEYFLLKYNQFASDFSNELVQQCRGSIFKMNQGKCVCVCRPFRKFFNSGEPQAACIDWDSARVLEKVDGSIMKVWYDNESWHLSTNGTINAFKAEIVDGLTFGEVFERAAGCTLDRFCTFLSPYYTYIFELTSPDTQVVIPYEDGIYWLATKDTQTERELNHRAGIQKMVKDVCKYDHHNLDECLQSAGRMGKDEEGFVVVDKYLNRVKIKSPEYLHLHHLVNNHTLSYRRLFDLAKEGKLDDLYANFPQHREKIDIVAKFLKHIYKLLAEDCVLVAGAADLSQKDFAELVADRANFSSFCFFNRKRGITPQNYIAQVVDSRYLADLLLEWQEEDKND
jgi:T4 RnlA family RNA ligase